MIGTPIVDARLTRTSTAPRAPSRFHPAGAIHFGAQVASASDVLSGRLVESSFLGNIVDHQVDMMERW